VPHSRLGSKHPLLLINIFVY